MSNSDEMPSRPARTLSLPHLNRVARKTGYEPTRHTSKAGIRRRERPVDDFVSRPTASKIHPNPIFDYFFAEADKGDSPSCVFLLWSSRNPRTHAVDVRVEDRDNEDEIFGKLARRYADEQNAVRKCLSLREFDRLEPVTVCSL